MGWRPALIAVLAVVAATAFASTARGDWHPGGDPLAAGVADGAALEGCGRSGADVNGVPYVAWVAYPDAINEVQVASFDGSAWHQLGGSLNVDPARQAQSIPAIANVAGVPFVTWVEENDTGVQVRVKRW